MLRLNRILLTTLVLGSAFSPSLAAQGDWDLLGTRQVSMAKETDVIDVTRRDGRFNALRIEVEGGPIEIYNIRVEFANGENFSPATRISFSETERTRVIDLPGPSRDIERIVFRYRGPLRLGSASVRVYGRKVDERPVTPRPEQPVVRAPDREGWIQMGSREVDLRTDRDVIQVTGNRRFNTILLAVEGADVEISHVRVNFANGQHFDPQVRLVFEENSRSRFIDLPGEARDIRNIEFRYRTLRRNNVNQKAVVHVYGKTRSVGNLPSEDGWTQIGAREVDLRTDRDVIQVTGNRRFNTILLAVEGADVEISNVRVNFANGQHFDPQVRLVFEENSRSRFIDLPGEARDIKNIEFRYRTLRRNNVNQKAVVHVYGKTRSVGNTPSEDGWTQIGAREVDFRTDRDVIQAESNQRFNTILLAVEGADVEISNVRVNFANGQHFDPQVRLVFEENSRSRFIDLPGEARDIKNIEFRYRTIRQGSGNNKAIVHVYGKTRNGGR